MDRVAAVNLARTVPQMEYRASKRKYSGTYQNSYPGLTRWLVIVLLFLWGLNSAGFTYENGSRRTMYLELSWGVGAGQYHSTIVIFLLSVVVLLTIVANKHITSGIHVTYIFFIIMAAVVVTAIIRQELRTAKYSEAQNAVALVYMIVMLIVVLIHVILRRLMPALHHRNSSLTRPHVWPCPDEQLDMPAMARWQKVLSEPVSEQTFYRQSPWQIVLPSCLLKPGLLGYKGQVDEQGQPHGLGEWNTGQWNGEHYQGLWHHGLPIPPFTSREVGSASSFVGHRIAFVQCREETDPWSSNVFPTVGTSLKWGVTSVETSASGVFFMNYPFVQMMSRSELFGVETGENASNAGPFEVPGVEFSSSWIQSTFEDYDEAFGIKKGVDVVGVDEEEGRVGELPVRDTTWMRDLLKGLSPPEGALTNPNTSWRNTGNVVVYVDGAGGLDVSGHVVDSGTSSPTRRGGNRSLTIRPVRRDLRQDTLQAVASSALAVVGRPLNMNSMDPSLAEAIATSHDAPGTAGQDADRPSDQGSLLDMNDSHLVAPSGPVPNIPLVSTDSAVCLKVEGWVPRSRVGAYEAVIFIHGYNTWPVNCVEKLGQLLGLGNFPDYVKPIVFSWPAGGHPLVYPGARHTCKSQQLVAAFMELLRALQAERVTSVHILGHSMGARVVMAVAPAMLHGYKKGYLKVSCSSITLLQPEYALKPFCEKDVAIMHSFCPVITVYGNGKDGALGPAEYMAPMLDTFERTLPIWMLQPGAKADRVYERAHGMRPSTMVPGTVPLKPVGASQTQPTSHLMNQDARVRHHVSGTTSPSILHRTARKAVQKASPWYYETMLGRAVQVGLVVDPETKKFLDVDMIDTTYIQANVHKLRHTFFHLNHEIVADLRDIIVSKRRARQRSRLELIGGNVYGFLEAPTYVLND